MEFYLHSILYFAALRLIKQNENAPNKNEIQFFRINALTQQSQVQLIGTAQGRPTDRDSTGTAEGRANKHVKWPSTNINTWKTINT